MAYRKRKRLSVWGVLARLGLPLRGGCYGGDRDEIIQHVFESASRQTLRSQDGEPISGDDFLVSVFESLGTTKDWPGGGSPEWERLRTVALRRVVARLARDGLLDSIAVGSATDVADGEDGRRARDMDADCETNSNPPAAKDEGLVADAVDGDEAPTANDCEQDGESEPDVETPSAKDGSMDPREGVQVFRSYIRRGQRNSDGWFRGVDRMTPYKVIVRWASENCPGASMESLVALLDGLRAVRWWDDDGHVQGAEMLAVLESELEEGCGHEQWMLVVSDFEAAIRRLSGVFEKLCLL